VTGRIRDDTSTGLTRVEYTMDIIHHQLVGDGIRQETLPAAKQAGPLAPDTIVIHYTAGATAASAVDTFLNPHMEVSSRWCRSIRSPGTPVAASIASGWG